MKFSFSFLIALALLCLFSFDVQAFHGVRQLNVNVGTGGYVGGVPAQALLAPSYATVGGCQTGGVTQVPFQAPVFAPGYGTVGYGSSLNLNVNRGFVNRGFSHTTIHHGPFGTTVHHHGR